MTFTELLAMFPDEEACKTYLVSKRWPNGIRCPRCGNDKVFSRHASALPLDL